MNMGVSPPTAVVAEEQQHVQRWQVEQGNNGETVRGGALRPAKDNVRIASWNVEGLTEVKIVQWQRIMKR